MCVCVACACVHACACVCVCVKFKEIIQEETQKEEESRKAGKTEMEGVMVGGGRGETDQGMGETLQSYQGKRKAQVKPILYWLKDNQV